jgi:hypothetical protein
MSVGRIISQFDPWLDNPTISRREMKRMQQADKEAIRELEQIMRTVRLELAALLPNPSNWDSSQWPVENPTDAACLSAAYQQLTDALGYSTYVAGTTEHSQ